jgi:hypothetical protein
MECHPAAICVARISTIREAVTRIVVSRRWGIVIIECNRRIIGGVSVSGSVAVPVGRRVCGVVSTVAVAGIISTAVIAAETEGQAEAIVIVAMPIILSVPSTTPTAPGTVATPAATTPRSVTAAATGKCKGRQQAHRKNCQQTLYRIAYGKALHDKLLSDAPKTGLLAREPFV